MIQENINESENKKKQQMNLVSHWKIKSKQNNNKNLTIKQKKITSKRKRKRFLNPNILQHCYKVNLKKITYSENLNSFPLYQKNISQPNHLNNIAYPIQEGIELKKISTIPTKMGSQYEKEFDNEEMNYLIHKFFIFRSFLTNISY